MELSTKRQLGREVVQLIELEQVELLGCIPEVRLLLIQSPFLG